MVADNTLQTLTPDSFALNGLGRLQEMPQPPTTLWLHGTAPPTDLPLLTVVGSRAYTTYGKQAVEELLSGLANYHVGIVSGLARGMDGLAHRAALTAGLYTLAIPGSGLDRSVLYPARHRALAEEIRGSGGALLSELSPTTRAAKWTFTQRNRLMAALAHGTLLIEAEERSGTLVTARLTIEYDRELLVVPGSIFSPQSRGTHQFLKLGATPITSSADIADALNLEQRNSTAATAAPPDVPTELAELLPHLTHPTDIDSVARAAGRSVSSVSAALMQLEMSGHVRVENGLYQARI